MIRSAASKVMWVGRATVFLVGLAVILALVFGVATTALGANGKPFLLGKWNAATALTKLTGNVNGAAMQVVNPNTGTNDTALSLSVQAGEAPMAVNSAKKVTNLNADRIDDREASSFANGVGGVATNADKLDGKDSSEFLGKTEKATDADQLDGNDSTEFATQAGLNSEANTRASADTNLQTAISTLGNNDYRPNEASDPVNYTKVKDIPSAITDRNAITLDSLYSWQFMRSRTYRTSVSGTGVADKFTDLYVYCDSGDQVLSGGYHGVDYTTTLLYASNPTSAVDGWFVSYRSGSTADNVDAYALCVDRSGN